MLCRTRSELAQPTASSSTAVRPVDLNPRRRLHGWRRWQADRRYILHNNTRRNNCHNCRAIIGQRAKGRV